MPEIELRPVITSDLPLLLNMEHSYHSSYVWQMDRSIEDSQFLVKFRMVRLPRPVRVEYTSSLPLTPETWPRFTAVLGGFLSREPVGYIALLEHPGSRALWVTDCSVREDLRRKGIGSALILAAQEWALETGCRKLVLEMQSKNYPAIQMARKLGFEFCGYNDNYFHNQDIALFFSRLLR